LKVFGRLPVVHSSAMSCQKIMKTISVRLARIVMIATATIARWE
jgi:hypothetical protein